MQRLLFLLITCMLFTFAKGQDSRIHKIVFDMVSSDTADQNGVLRQINNILTRAPNSQIEIVFHGKSVYAMTKDKTTIESKVNDLKQNKQVVFAVCNNSMKRLQLTAADLIPAATVVPVAILELAEKQEEGWSYVKAGH